MLIDVNAWCGRWPFAPRVATEPKAIADQLAAEGVTQAHVSSIEAVLSPDPIWEERKLAAQLVGVDMLVPAPIIHPLRRGWRDALKRAADAGAKIIKLIPTHHGYAPDAPDTIELAQNAAQMNLTTALLLRIEDERRQYPMMKIASPTMMDVQHLADCLAPQPLLLLAAFYGEVVATASVAPNLHYDLSFCELDDPARRTVEAAGADRIHFGTYAPLMVPKAQRMKLDHSTLDDATRNAVMYDNTVSLFG